MVAVLKRIWTVFPLGIVFCLVLSVFSVEVTKMGLLVLPFMLFVWIRKKNADIWMEKRAVGERIIFVILKNKEMLQFLGRKVGEQYAKVGDKLIETLRNTAYVFAGKIMMIARQEEDVDPKEIYELKEELTEPVLHPKILRSRSFWKCMGLPLVALSLFSIPPFSFPAFMAPRWVFLLASPLASLLFVWNSGALEFASAQGRRDITTFYFSGARKMEPLRGESLAEGYISLPGHGAIRLADDTDFFLGTQKIFLSSRGVNHSFNLDMAEKATWFRQIGLRDKYDLRAAFYLVTQGEYKQYETIEKALEEEGNEFVKAARSRAEHKKVELKLTPEMIQEKRIAGTPALAVGVPAPIGGG